MKFTLIGSTGDPLQDADDFEALDWPCLIGTIRWELWAGEQCLAQVDLEGQPCTPGVVERVYTTVKRAIPHLSLYQGRVVIRVGECFRPLIEPDEMYVVIGQHHDPKKRCAVCWAKGWGQKYCAPAVAQKASPTSGACERPGWGRQAGPRQAE